MGKALVTGAAGFIGSHVADNLLKLGVEVVALDDLSGGYYSNVPDEAEWIESSVTDYEVLNNLFEERKFDYVFHLAAYAAENLSHFIRRYNYDVNLLGSVNLINLSVLHDIDCFVFTSSIAVYGHNEVPMVETMVPDPEDPYGISKYAVELDLRAAKNLFDLDYIVFRPHNVYGEHQNIGDKYRNVIGIFMNQILNGESLTVFGDGTQTRAFSYIDDVAPIIARSIFNTDACNEVFNIGADKPYSINELVQTICREMDVEPDIKYLPERNEVKHAFASHEKVNEFFNMKDITILREGVSKMVKWVREIGSRKTGEFTNIEIPFGLPRGW